MHSLETCTIVFHHFSLILFPKAIHFFLPDIQILLCSKDVSQLRLISTSLQCTPPFQAEVIHKNINPDFQTSTGKTPLLIFLPFNTPPPKTVVMSPSIISLFTL